MIDGQYLGDGLNEQANEAAVSDTGISVVETRQNCGRQPLGGRTRDPARPGRPSQRS